MGLTSRGLLQRQHIGIDAYMPPRLGSLSTSSRGPAASQHRGPRGSATPLGTNAGDSIQDCQSRTRAGTTRPCPQVHQATRQHPQLQAPLRLIMNEKLKDCGQKPTPQDIAHAIELQELLWTNNGKTRPFIVGLSGFPRLIVDKMEPYACTNLFRVYHECIEQPYHLLNATMRNVQSNNNSVYLEIRSSRYRGTYMCDGRNMGTGQPVPMYQQRTRHRVKLG
eukprot:TRINITY_DN5676_c0_g1_i3.p1 TRINITY_DN5676_c0_g1~~TRINITY_DN5676_c0_g1_i3.p1  ORF type:complete len:222 (-),score=13.59 TRINITY_DN5676_c0_g1_i3:223-888(-)